MWNSSLNKLNMILIDMDPTINVVDLSKTYGSSFFKKLFDCKFGNSQANHVFKFWIEFLNLGQNRSRRVERENVPWPHYRATRP